MRRSQALATLGAASLQDQPPVLGRHPRAKTVRLGPAAIVRLKSAFRHSCLFSTLKKSVRLTAEALSVKKARLDFALFEPKFSLLHLTHKKQAKPLELTSQTPNALEKHSPPRIRAFKMSVLKSFYSRISQKNRQV